MVNPLDWASGSTIEQQRDAPQLDLFGPPAPPPPRPQVVDRQAYLRQQLEQRRQQMLAAIQPILQVQRDAQRQTALMEQYRRMQEGEQAPRAGFEPVTQDPFPIQAALSTPSLPSSLGHRLIGQGVNALRTDIPAPIREPIVRGVQEAAQTALGGGPFGRAAEEAVSRIPYAGAPVNVLQGVKERISEETANALVPREVWDTALTLLPAAKARTIPELLAAISIGDVDAVRAIRQAGERLGASEAVQRFIRAGERGEAPIEPFGTLKDSIMKVVRRNKPLRLAQEEVRHEERIVRSGKIEEALRSGLAPDEMIRALDAARKGALHTAEFEPFQFSPEQWKWILDEVVAAPSLAGKGYTQGNAIDALRRVERGFGLRQFEEKLLREVFGEEFVQAIRERGTDDMLANIARAWTPLGVDPMSLQEVVPVGQRYFTPAVQQGVDVNVAARFAELQKRGRGAYGIAESPSLEANIARAVKVPASMGPVEQTRVVRPFSNATEAAADDAATNAINAAHLESQLQKGAQPEWYYRQQVEAAEKRALDALNDPDPLKATGAIWRDRVLTPFQMWRSWKTTFDNSFLGRQGWKLLASNTREWVGAYRRSWQAMWSSELAAHIDAEVKAFPTYELGQRMKRPLAVLGPQRRGEEFLTSTEKVPLLNRFERAYNASANYVRQASLERDVNTWIRHNGNTPIPDAIAQAFVDDINNVTLYGNISKLGENVGLLGQTFFSLRAKASLGQFLMDTVRVMRPGVDPTLRRIVATRFAGWLTLNMSLLYAAKWAGAKTGALEVGMNPYGADWGKIKVGPQTFDLWGGYAPLVRAVIGIGSGGVNERNPSEIGAQYTRYQFSPAAGVFYDFSFGGGKDYRGKNLYDKKTLIQYGLDQVDPLFFADVWDAWKANGIIGAGLGGAASFSGIGTQAYTSSLARIDHLVEGEKIARTEGGFYEHYRDLPPDIKGEFDKRHPQEVSAVQQYRATRGRDTFDKLHKETLDGLAALAPLRKTDPATYREQAGDFVGDQALLTQRELQRLKDEGVDLGDRKGDLGLLDGYFNAVDPATDKMTHVVDFDKRDTLVDAYRASLKPEQQQRLDEMLGYSADPTYQELKKAKTQLDAGGYYDRRDEAFADWKKQASASPNFRARYGGKLASWNSPDDLRRAAQQEMIDAGRAPELYDRSALWNTWESVYNENSAKFLHDNPVIDVLAIQWGYQSRVHSQAAADLYEERTGLRAPVPGQ